MDFLRRLKMTPLQQMGITPAHYTPPPQPDMTPHKGVETGPQFVDRIARAELKYEASLHTPDKIAVPCGHGDMLIDRPVYEPSELPPTPDWKPAKLPYYTPISPSPVPLDPTDPELGVRNLKIR